MTATYTIRESWTQRKTHETGKEREREREGAGRTGLETLRNVHPGRRPSGLFDRESERAREREGLEAAGHN